MIRTLTTACLFAGIAIGCNHDNVMSKQQEERNDLARDQTEEQRELVRDQHAINKELTETEREQDRQRTDLAHDQANERQEQRADAREDLVNKTNAVAGNRQELNMEVRELGTLVTQACAAVPEAERNTCPLSSDRVAAVSNVNDGVRLTLTSIAGTRANVEERLGCYRARAEIRSSTARLTGKAKTPGAGTESCMLNLPGVEMKVADSDGAIMIDLTTETAAQVRELRTHARALMAPPGPLAATPRAQPLATNTAAVAR